LDRQRLALAFSGRSSQNAGPLSGEHMMKRLVPATMTILLALPGCQTTGVDQADAAAQSMHNLKQALEDAPAKITAVTASLTELSKEGGDMKAEFRDFSGKVDALVSHREKVRSLRTDVEASKATFTNAWEQRLQSIKDAELRARASKRRDAVMTKFGALGELADASKAEFEPWIQTVVDVRTYLESDLNPSGVASVSDKVKTIDKGAASVNKSLSSIVKELDEMGKAIAAAKPPPPPPPEQAPADKK
jgi:hypothetical protein